MLTVEEMKMDMEANFFRGRLVRPETSLFYKVRETALAPTAPPAGRSMRVGTDTFAAMFLGTPMQVILVEHDWGSAFFRDDDDLLDAPVPLPFDNTAFEFAIGGYRLWVIYPYGGLDTDGQPVFALRTGDGEVLLVDEQVALEPGEGVSGVARMLLSEEFMRAQETARAICVGFDAGIMAHNGVAAPEKLNKSRARQGKPMVNGYRTVSLLRRPHTDAIRSRADWRGKVRLHFRRGHKRYAGTPREIWVKWCLVGNPDLGFIDKHYRA